jgi:hypothetical protein
MKRDKTCKEIILEYINNSQGWIKKASLYSVAEDFSPETVGRACRDLEEEGLIQKSFYDGKYATGLVQYAKISYTPKVPKYEEVLLEDGRRVMREINA